MLSIILLQDSLLVNDFIPVHKSVRPYESDNKPKNSKMPETSPTTPSHASHKKAQSFSVIQASEQSEGSETQGNCT